MNAKKDYIITPVSLRHWVTEVVGLKILAWSPTIELFHLERKLGRLFPTTSGMPRLFTGFLFMGIHPKGRADALVKSLRLRGF